MVKTLSSEFSFRLIVISLAVPILMTQSRGMDFNFSNFQACNTDEILCVGDAKVSGHVIELTDNQTDRYSTGRVFYNETTQLFSIVSFSTHFQFTMQSDNLSSTVAGGIAFFMSSKENAYMPGRVKGWYGLPTNNSYAVPGLFAVAFRSLTNSVSIIGTNPVYTVGNNSHAGYHSSYDLNQILRDGTLKNAWIDYDSKTQHLKVFLSNGTNSFKSQGNQIFSHPIDLSEFLPEYIAVGLSGSSHNTGQTSIIFSWSFSTKNRKMKRDRTSTKLVVGLGSVAALCTAGALLLWGYFAFVRKRKLQLPISGQTCNETEINLDNVLEHGPNRFNLEDLKAATDDFSETQKLGQGGFGGVYKGTMVKTNQVVAVKRISEGSRQGMKEFISEISIVSRVRHRNLVQLLGWCYDRDQLFLVYEYMANGSLDRHLFTKENHLVLAWNRRYEIACEIASGLLYLHEEWNQCIVHRDVKSSNVMLDSNFSAKLGDFGLARILEHDHLSQTTVAAGTWGYLAPECVITGKTSPESDVYSFGLWLLK